MPSPLHSVSAPALSQVTVALIGAGPFADAYAPLLQCVPSLALSAYCAMHLGRSFMQPSHDRRCANFTIQNEQVGALNVNIGVQNC